MSRKGDGSKQSKWQNLRIYLAVDDVSRGFFLCFLFRVYKLSCTCKIPFHKNELGAPEKFILRNFHPRPFHPFKLLRIKSLIIHR